MELCEININQIQFDLESRDEIAKRLMGPQHIDTNVGLHQNVFQILEGLTPSHFDLNNGRKGMDYWKILALGTLRLACN